MDNITRILSEELLIRAYTVSSLDTVRELTLLHETSPNGTLALGRALTAAALLSATLKPDSPQSLSVKFFGDGPLGEVLVQADARGSLRGYLKNPRPDLETDIGSLSFSKSIGAGFLTVIRDLGMKEPYTSTLPLLYGDVAGDISYYLTTSEQVPSALIIALEMDSKGIVNAAGGILIQTLPETPDHVIEELDKKIKAMPVSLGESLLAGESSLEVLQKLLGNTGIKILSQSPLQARCRCSRGLIEGTLRGIDKNELREMIEKDRGAEVLCTFCLKKYVFTAEELESFLASQNH